MFYGLITLIAGTNDSDGDDSGIELSLKRSREPSKNPLVPKLRKFATTSTSLLQLTVNQSSKRSGPTSQSRGELELADQSKRSNEVAGASCEQKERCDGCSSPVRENSKEKPMKSVR